MSRRSATSTYMHKCNPPRPTPFYPVKQFLHSPWLTRSVPALSGSFFASSQKGRASHSGRVVKSASVISRRTFGLWSPLGPPRSLSARKRMPSDRAATAFANSGLTGGGAVASFTPLWRSQLGRAIAAASGLGQRNGSVTGAAAPPFHTCV
jgi:hypothetical protein